jgi:dihydrofolate synthase / folylpolyglutamate synthase
VTYAATLDYLYAQLPMYQRVGAAAYKKDLANTLALCEHLGNPHRLFPSIHVGGTNGKGSVSHMLAALCQAQGLKTGLYTSPHYKDFRERIKIDGQYIPRRRVSDFVEKHRAFIETLQPSFFELTVALAFDYFAAEQVDIAIIEVGLGGRLDSTNVITPLLSVITNISYDHMNLLGDTLPLIAAEKAGIIKPGVPVVIGETHPESAPVFLKKAAEVQAPIVFADAHFRAEQRERSHWKSTIYDVFKNDQPYLSGLEVQAAGPFQAKNLATVLQAWESLTRFMGRWQVIGHNPTVLCDSAHNEAGIRLAFEKISQHLTPHPSLLTPHSLHIVTGFVNDKDVGNILRLFPTEARYYFAKADIPRGLDAAALRDQAAACGLRGRAYVSVKNALRAARRKARPEDLVVVIGSIFVVAEVLP